MVDETYRSGTGFRLGRDDGWTCSACFAFGNLVGFNFNGAASNNFVNSSYEILTASGVDRRPAPGKPKRHADRRRVHE